MAHSLKNPQRQIHKKEGAVTDTHYATQCPNIRPLTSVMDRCQTQERWESCPLPAGTKPEPPTESISSLLVLALAHKLSCSTPAENLSKLYIKYGYLSRTSYFYFFPRHVVKSVHQRSRYSLERILKLKSHIFVQEG